MALLLTLVAMLLVGLVVAGFGIFRYQQLASLAREGARFASVYGGQFQKETGRAAATPSEVYDRAILPKAGGLVPSALTYSVAWADASKLPVYYDFTANAWRRNIVTVTVNYQWVPES